ncbi:hypothetical protein ILUMI_07624 [Ignelater luminosus]|uniref:tRNA-specific adenosine deaminase 1 n=1 Tax=Ignelater luminosus TaxID=2038154 RepID=A0A8K0D367_IGNLU|nr:hypothetical protein ILUMI_07624 [Ignelater luminosus]
MTENFHNKIAKLCIDHFQNLPKTGKPTAKEWTILSCIVKENTIAHHLEVVALGTGSKCIGKSRLSPKGDILNDSHAEIICRRAFLRYIYDQLNKIFTFNKNTARFHLDNSIKFHFFTTHVPCGDAAIFPKQDFNEFGDAIETDLSIASPNGNLKRPADGDINVKNKQTKGDIYRTGAKCLPGETKQDLHVKGLEFHTTGAVRTKPGRGDPTLSVSCSDKIAKWCHLGVQGALLSILLEKPLYLTSFTISAQTQFCINALERALYDRFDTIEMKSPYRLNKMMLGQASSIGFEFSKVESKQPCPSSIAWCKINSRPLEVAVEGKKQGITKKKQNTKSCRLQISKIELFRSFLTTIEKNRNLFNLFGNIKLSELQYGVAKSNAKEYQEMWTNLKLKHFKLWTVKDSALLQFVVD